MKPEPYHFRVIIRHVPGSKTIYARAFRRNEAYPIAQTPEFPEDKKPDCYREAIRLAIRFHNCAPIIGGLGL